LDNFLIYFRHTLSHIFVFCIFLDDANLVSKGSLKQFYIIQTSFIIVFSKKKKSFLRLLYPFVYIRHTLNEFFKK